MNRPLKIVAVLGYIAKSWRWKDRDQSRFMSRMHDRKIKYLRVFTVNPWSVTPCSSPFHYDEDTGKFDLDIFNPLFFAALKDLATRAGDFKMALVIDLFDHCGTNKKLRKKNPWYNNSNDVVGFYDTSKKSMFYQQKLIKKIADTIGFMAKRKNAIGITVPVRRHIYSLGNELYTARGLGSSYHWIGRDWALPHALYLRTLGYKGKIFFSAHFWAAHAIWGYLGPEGEWCGSTFKIKDLVQQLHGMSYPTWVDDKVKPFSHGRHVGIADDGTNIKYSEDRGICTNGDRYCSATTELVCVTVGYTATMCEERNRKGRKHRILHHIEQLPRSISEDYQSLNNLNQHRDVNVWKAIGRRVYGQDWTRTTPRYLRKRYDLKGQ